MGSIFDAFIAGQNPEINPINRENPKPNRTPCIGTGKSDFKAIAIILTINVEIPIPIKAPIKAKITASNIK